jgi:signal transduction histidine kinase
MQPEVTRPSLGRGLSARLLALTVAFVLVGELLIYVPSIARFRATFLEARLASAHLASLAVELGGTERLPPELEAALLRHAGVLSITLWRPHADVMLGRIDAVDQVYDFRATSAWQLIADSMTTLAHGGRRVIRVLGPSPQQASTIVDVVMEERQLWLAMVDYSWRILALSVALSLIVATLLFLGLRRMIVMPLARLTEALQRFRERPEDAAADLPPSPRRDEIGVVERELHEMRRRIRDALMQQTRLAALGAAVARINHDLRNILATSVLLSERLDASADPEVRKVAPRLIEAMERAARLCAETLRFARSEPSPPRPQPFALRELVADVLGGPAPDSIRMRNEVPAGLWLKADPDQLYRVLLNLVRNARQALGDGGGEIRVEAGATRRGVQIDVKDSGGGLTEQARAHLFEPFSASSKVEGTGLGLAISRELIRAHGGDISLLETSSRGTTFRLTLPERCLVAAELETV